MIQVPSQLSSNPDISESASSTSTVGRADTSIHSAQPTHDSSTILSLSSKTRRRPKVGDSGMTVSVTVTVGWQFLSLWQWGDSFCHCDSGVTVSGGGTVSVTVTVGRQFLSLWQWDDSFCHCDSGTTVSVTVTVGWQFLSLWQWGDSFCHCDLCLDRTFPTEVSLMGTVTGSSRQDKILSQ